MELKQIKAIIMNVLSEINKKQNETYYYGSIEIKSGDCKIVVEDLKEMYNDEGFSCEILAECLGQVLIVNETTAPTMIEAVVKVVSRVCGRELSSLYELEKEIEKEDKENWEYWEACEREELENM